MFNLDAFAESMKDSVPKKMSYSLDELLLIRNCIDSVLSVIEFVESFGNDRLKYEFDMGIVDLLYIFCLSCESSDSLFENTYEDLKELRLKLNSFSFN